MSNALYPEGRLAIAKQDVDLLNDTVSVVALDSTYTYSALDSQRSDLTGELGTAQNLTGKQWLSDAIFDADNVSYPGVAALAVVRALVVFVDSGSPATSTLIAFVDETTQGVHINMTGTGAPIPILWDDSPHRVFRL